MPPTQHPIQARHTVGLVASYLLDLLFPPRCAGCGRVDTPWCDQCQARLDAVPLDTARRRPPPPLKAIVTTGIHTGYLQSLVQALKYDNAHTLAKPLAARLSRRISPGKVRFDTVAAVPLHVQRFKERGYNQSELLAQQVAELLGKQDFSGYLHRDFYTRPQVGLNRTARLANVADAFRADPVFSGRRVLLIDDVFTTGATMSACAQAIMEGGAQAVYGLTVTAAAQQNTTQ